MQIDSNLRCLDLFCGAGGLSLGLSLNNIDIVAATDKVDIYCKTHQRNFPECKTITADISKITPSSFARKSKVPKGSIDIIVGGPPCQTFSTIGTPKIASLRNGDMKSDPRNYLFNHFFYFVRYYRPSIFILENVPTLKTRFGGSLFQKIEYLIDSLGYTPQYRILNSVEYGAPQIRRRLFIVGTAAGISFKFPNPTHESLNEKTEELSLPLFPSQSLKPPTTVYDAIADLPDITDGCRERELPYSKNEELTPYQKMMRNPNGLVDNNTCRISNDRAKKLFPHMKQGSTYMQLPEEIRSILPFREDIFHDRLKRLDMTKPSWTVLAHIGMDGYMYIHPTKNRTLSVREATRIQSFPDSFIFMGNMREQYIQVGNAVAPLVANALGNSIREALN